MCSIIGYRGDGPAAPVIVSGLKRMEYRGYDSVGVATQTGSGISLKKGVGRVAEVNQSAGLDGMPGTIGIGHTRWATHGQVTDANAHPHACNSGAVAVVHNGTIENFEELKKGLSAAGYSFTSETDTEVIANQLQKNYSAEEGAESALLKTLPELRGRYAFVAMFEDGTMVAARLHEPLIVGVGEDSYFLSSDVLGFIERTDDAIYIDNGCFVVVDEKGMRISRFDGTPVRPQITKVSKEIADAYKGDYAHFTLKEISEQPDTILRCGGDGGAVEQMAGEIRRAGTAYITGSGTSYNAALVARHVMSKYADTRLEPIIASELPHSPFSAGEGSVFIAVSQSGESADVIDAAAIARDSGARIVSIVNMRTSSLARESDVVVGMNCGPEIGVAATKSFTSQLGIIYKMADIIGGGRAGADFAAVSKAISGILSDHAGIKKLAGELRDVTDMYVLGRGVHYPMAAEAALKLKELTYVHAEGIPGGELKHGPLALMGPGVYAVIMNPADSTYEDTLTGAREIRARGAKIIGISDKNSDVYDHWVELPRVGESSYPLVEMVPVQLLAYYLALEKDTDPDHPRNLAKSVTVR
ncbi:glucosamine 6-phosphate synthetase [Cenarchaeum symbiosum A]|uniref:Glutamine--fructose-6-phosphate aminotransferase [isomerizing] n=1 Tax=Cenarchaeum symbiosum (strain A) TaxID=414004 RepID=A0RY03_CENSY|nr:glucosamine 6-phosphate synthetase [Cenarchaeum symbiosum A]